MTGSGRCGWGGASAVDDAGDQRDHRVVGQRSEDCPLTAISSPGVFLVATTARHQIRHPMALPEGRVTLVNQGFGGTDTWSVRLRWLLASSGHVSVT